MMNPAVVQQHADDAVALAANRQTLVCAPYATVARLRNADERLRANLEGLSLTGADASAFYNGMRETPSPGALFVLTVQALEQKERAALDELFAIVQAVPEALEGMLPAFEWVDSSTLRGIVADLLADRDGFKRTIGVAACAMHRVDPGAAVSKLLQDENAAVRARVFRAAGELGRRDLLAACAAAASADQDPEIRFWAAWSAVQLGDRQTALDVLVETAGSTSAHRDRAFRLAIQSMDAGRAHEALQPLAGDPKKRRALIQGSGLAGDPAYLPWLLKQMNEQQLTRIAGEAFALIAGVDLNGEAMDRPAPEGFESGPNDNPDDPNVDMDPDDGLPWPDPEKVEQWWAANAARFQPGTRYFMGAPVTRAHCIDVLKNGYQRQRILAAHYLCLLEPGTPLFNTSAPAWRQQRLLAQMA